MKVNIVKIGSKFQDTTTNDIVLVRTFKLKWGIYPFAVCDEFYNGEKITETNIDLSLLYNPTHYKELCERK